MNERSCTVSTLWRASVGGSTKSGECRMSRRPVTSSMGSGKRRRCHRMARWRSVSGTGRGKKLGGQPPCRVAAGAEQDIAILAVDLSQRAHQAARIAPDAGALAHCRRIVNPDAHQLDLSVGPHAIDDKVPEQHHADSDSFRQVIAPHAPVGEHPAIQREKDGLVDAQAHQVDQAELPQLGQQRLSCATRDRSRGDSR